MRKSTAVLAFGLMAGLLGDGARSDAQSFTPGLGQRPLTFKTIDTTNIVGGRSNMQNIFRPPPTPRPFNLLNIFRKPPVPTWPPRTVNPSAMSTTQAQVGGTTPQQAARMRPGNQPMMPNSR